MVREGRWLGIAPNLRNTHQDNKPNKVSKLEETISKMMMSNKQWKVDKEAGVRYQG